MRLDPITEQILFKSELLKLENNTDIVTEEILQEFIISLKPEKINNALLKNLKAMKMFLKDHGISTGQLKSYSKQAAKIVEDGYKAKKDPKVISSQIVNRVFNKAVKKAIKGAKYTKEEKEDPPLSKKISKAIVVYVILVIGQGMLMSLVAGTVLSFGLSPSIILVITFIVIAPLTEEFAKRLAIKEKYPWVFTGVFAGIEAIKYIVQMIQLGGSAPAVLITRAIVFMMHFATTFVQKYLMDKVGEGELSEKWGIISFVIAVSLHAIWNGMGLMFAIEINDAIGLEPL
jgi:hypothetical protein